MTVGERDGDRRVGSHARARALVAATAGVPLAASLRTTTATTTTFTTTPSIEFAQILVLGPLESRYHARTTQSEEEQEGLEEGATTPDQTRELSPQS